MTQEMDAVAITIPRELLRGIRRERATRRSSSSWMVDLVESCFHTGFDIYRAGKVEPPEQRSSATLFGRDGLWKPETHKGKEWTVCGRGAVAWKRTVLEDER
jgi:hypothetical protein